MNIEPRFAIEDDDLELLRRFNTWIGLVVKHAAIDYQRRQKYLNRELPLEYAPDDSLTYEDLLPTGKDNFEFTEDNVSKAFSNLSQLRRRILTLTFVEGLSAQETAAILGCSVDYVYLHKHRALKKLRDQLMEEGNIDGN